MNNTITYERNIYKSYMKMPSPKQECLDERILLSRKIEGLLAIEKSYLDGDGQYWYDISGKQALDYYCKANEVGITLLEQLILQICNQLERFEWNLLREECLLLRPETIFLSLSDETIFFTGYPVESGNVFTALREFMEFLLTRIDHSDQDAVVRAYELYEMLLRDEFHIGDLKKLILDKRVEKQTEDISRDVEKVERIEVEVEKEEEGIDKAETSFFKKYWDEFVEKIGPRWSFLSKEKVSKKEKSKEWIQDVVYPGEDEHSLMRPDMHPTVCLTSANNEARGLLVYEGTENFKDYEIGNLMCVVGKSHRVKLQIEKDTISHFHAKIDWKEGAYYIEDMNSTNGTFVNDELLNYRESRKLSSGDIVRFADVKYRFW